MNAMVSQITSLTTVYSTVYLGEDQITNIRVTGLCEGNWPVTGEFAAQRASNTENVFIWWRHHEFRLLQLTSQLSDRFDILNIIGTVVIKWMLRLTIFPEIWSLAAFQRDKSFVTTARVDYIFANYPGRKNCPIVWRRYIHVSTLKLIVRNISGYIVQHQDSPIRSCLAFRCIL